jgi:hypothetical protein
MQAHFALTVASRFAASRFLQIAAISPNTAPHSKVATRVEPTRTSTSPKLKKYIESPTSPWRTISTPSANEQCSKRAFIPFLKESEQLLNKGTLSNLGLTTSNVRDHSLDRKEENCVGLGSSSQLA